MDLAIHVYLENFHDIIAQPSIKTYSLVDFEFLMSGIQLALLYLFSIAE